MNQETIYRCDKKCPIGKNCFVLKVKNPLKEQVEILHKCSHTKKDVQIIVGGDRPP